MTGPGSHHLVFRLDGVVAQTRLAAVVVGPGMGRLLREIAPVFLLWLFCDGQEKETAAAAETLRLDGLVPRSRWLFASEGFRVDLPDQLVGRLMERTGAPREEIIWIDDRPAVTSALIRAGMNAVAFVDAPRLRRNLVLRGLIK